MSIRDRALQTLRLWLDLEVPVSRSAYAIGGFVLMPLDYAPDAAVVFEVTGRTGSPLDYLNPSPLARDEALGKGAIASWLMLAMAAWTLPFLWVALSMTLRRALDAGRSPWLDSLSRE